ncbi:MAG TPA: hypothetical protein VF808_17365 [Ktedonobacterales bacterium]
MGEVGHIFGVLGRAIGRIFLVGLICGVLGFAVIIGAAYFGHSSHTITTLDYIIGGVVGVLALYAGAVTVLMSEAVKAALTVAADAKKEAGTAFKDAGGLVQGIEKEIGKHL